ncbi:hypothetical protein ACA910_013450 [Epithemia clementina (nom. ined.)]
MDLEQIAAPVDSLSEKEINAAVHNSTNNQQCTIRKTPRQVVRRTQSYDGAASSAIDGSGGENDGMGNTDSESPLHASFDVSQLSAYRQGGREASNGPNCSQVATTFTRNYLDMISAAASSSSATAKTPLRIRFPRSASSKSNKASGKRTPASARRHRLFSRRLSPAHRTPALSRSISADATPVVQQPAVAPQPPQPLFAWQQQNWQSIDSSPWLEITGATPAQKKKPKRSLGTVTTVANSTILETTTETDDSADTHNINASSTNTFRFSSFPASLPRIPTNAPQKRMVDTNIALDDGESNTSGHSFSLDPVGDHRPSDQHFGSLEDFDEMSTSPMGTPVGRRRLNFNSVMSPGGSNPGTPKDVKMHFQGGQCSPIRGIPEEDGDITRSSTSDKPSALLNQSLGSSSSADSSRAGRSRPMPDINAFEGDMSHDHSGENGGGGSSTRSHPQSPKLLCPPTPVRTPAWVHAPTDKSTSHSSSGQKQHLPHHKFGRQNSLIATKVLATCSQRDLEGRSSLENSLLEEDASKQHSRSQANESHANNSSILTYAESAAAATEPETDHPSSDRDHSYHHHSVHNLDDVDDDWLHHEQKGKCQLFEEDRDDQAFVPGGEVVSMSTSFEILGILGRGTFADVYKVRSRKDGKLYAVKKHRRQFRGRRDREITMAEVRHMQRLQSSTKNSVKSSYCLYLLFFYQAWQEDGHFFCQTELCCRDTCREFMDALRLNWATSRTRYPCLRRIPAPLGIAAGSDQDIIGRLVPEPTIWKICHDISAGLSHIHSHGLVHHDIKPSNIFLVAHNHFGAMCKIGDFGMAGDIGTSEDGQEGDQKYMAPELLSSDVKHPSADMFSLGLTLYELSSSLSFEVPSEGQLWHDLRSARNNASEIPPSRDKELINLIRQLICPDQNARLSADSILSNAKVQRAGSTKDEFLMAYIRDVEEYERRLQDMEIKTDDQTPRVIGRPRVCVSPSLSIPTAPILFSSPKHAPPYA